MSSLLELGFQSVVELGQEFIATVLGSGSTGQTSVVCGASQSDVALQTYFYLDPFEEPPENPECVGVDWVGKYFFQHVRVL